jgi:hypothetical protein
MVAVQSIEPKAEKMSDLVRSEKWSHCFNESDHDVQLKQVFESLESENGQLKKLVVQLSETIIRNVTAKR